MIRYKRLYESINPSGLNFRKDKQLKFLGTRKGREDWLQNPDYDIYIADAELGDYYFTFLAFYNLTSDPGEAPILEIFFRHKKDHYWYEFCKDLNRLNEFGRVAMEAWRKFCLLEEEDDLREEMIKFTLKNLGYYVIGDREDNEVTTTYVDVDDYLYYY